MFWLAMAPADGCMACCRRAAGSEPVVAALAVVLAVLGACCCAAGARLQHEAAAGALRRGGAARPTVGRGLSRLLPDRRCVAQAVGAGAAYGSVSVGMRAAGEEFTAHGFSGPLCATLAGLMLAGLTGFWLTQRAQAAGPRPGCRRPVRPWLWWGCCTSPVPSPFLTSPRSAPIRPACTTTWSPS